MSPGSMRARRRRRRRNDVWGEASQNGAANNTGLGGAVAMIRCERCHQEVVVTTTSYFDTMTICEVCSERERTHPEFGHAQRIEIEACKRGDYNFPGIGCPPDLLGQEARP